MELEEFVNNFAEQFEITDKKEISAYTEFKMLDEWDSLLGLSIIGMIHNVYKMKVSGEEINQVGTVENIFKLVQSKLETE